MSIGRTRLRAAALSVVAVMGLALLVAVPPASAVGTSSDLRVAFTDNLSPSGAYTVEDLETGSSVVVPGVHTNDAAISPDGTRVVYSAYPSDPNVPDYSQLWIAPADGSSPATQLTDDQCSATLPSWSADGSEIVADCRGNGVQIFDSSTGAEIGAAFSGRSPSFSPDGNQVVVQDQDGIDVIILGQSDTRIGTGSAPRWSPNGSSILFGSSGGPSGYTHLFTMNPDGTNVHELSGATPDSDEGVGSWAWAADSQTIVFTSYLVDTTNTEGSSDVYLTDRDGTYRSSVGVTPTVDEHDISAAGDLRAATAQAPGAAQATLAAAPADDPGAPSQVAVTWSAPTNPGGAPLTGYVITPLVGSTPQEQRFVSADTTDTTVTGLPKGPSYTFVVAAINPGGTGAASASSAPLPVPSTVPARPTRVMATRGQDASSVVSWDPSADDGGSTFDGYTVIGSPTGGCTAAATATSCTVTHLTNGDQYTFTVVATNAEGNSAPSDPTDTVVPVTTASAPGAPVVTSAGNGTVGLRWTPPLDDGGTAVDGYTVTPIANGQAQHPTYTSTTPSATIDELVDGTNYTFTVTASTEDGDGATSPASDPVTPRTTSSAAITSLTSRATAGARISLTGTVLDVNHDPEPGQQVYLQYRPLGSSAAFRTGPAVTTSTDGTASITTFVPAGSVEVRLWHPAQGAFATAVSPSRSITETRKITVKASASRIATKHRVIISGTVLPHSSGHVAYLQQQDGKAWRTIGHAVISTRSAYAITTSFNKRGTKVLRVYLKTDQSFAASVSSTVREVVS